MQPLGRFRSGPWPGLTPQGALVLLACSGLLAVLAEKVHVFAVFVPLALATVIVNTPGAASAVTGAYLLPRTLWSLLDPSVPLPPLLLAPAVVFDVVVWLRPTDLGALLGAWPRKRNAWRVRRDRSPRRLNVVRMALAAMAFALTLAMAEPAWQAFL